MKSLSICIPTYNRSKLLKSQVEFLVCEKVFEQKNVEVIISDNASTDDTTEYLNELKQKYNNIKILTNEVNCGAISNIKKLIENSKNDYIWIIGDDDILHKNVIQKVLKIINGYDNISHIFLNHSLNKNGLICNGKIYKVENIGYMNGIDLFDNVTKNAGLGALMFITANIYKKELVQNALSIINVCEERDNLAIPLGFSLFCSQGMGYIIDEVLLEDELGTISWEESSYKVFCRDMIAICDIISQHMSRRKEISKLLINNLPYKMPELMFFIFKKKYKYKSNNYAFKWMLKNYPLHLFCDILSFPFLVIIKSFKKVYTIFTT